MIYIIQVAFQDYDYEHYDHWISYSNVAYCATREAAEREIANHLSLKEITTNTVELSDYEERKSVDLYSIVEQELLH